MWVGVSAGDVRPSKCLWEVRREGAGGCGDLSTRPLRVSRQNMGRPDFLNSSMAFMSL